MPPFAAKHPFQLLWSMWHCFCTPCAAWARSRRAAAAEPSPATAERSIVLRSRCRRRERRGWKRAVFIAIGVFPTALGGAGRWYPDCLAGAGRCSSWHADIWRRASTRALRTAMEAAEGALKGLLSMALAEENRAALAAPPLPRKKRGSASDPHEAQRRRARLAGQALSDDWRWLLDATWQVGGPCYRLPGLWASLLLA